MPCLINPTDRQGNQTSRCGANSFCWTGARCSTHEWLIREEQPRLLPVMYWVNVWRRRRPTLEFRPTRAEIRQMSHLQFILFAIFDDLSICHLATVLMFTVSFHSIVLPKSNLFFKSQYLSSVRDEESSSLFDCLFFSPLVPPDLNLNQIWQVTICFGFGVCFFLFVLWEILTN